jgi:hypothetical protein
MPDTKDEDKLATILAEPKFDEFYEQTRRIRKTLLLLSTTTILMIWNNLDISINDISFIHINKVDNNLLKCFLLIALHLLYFISNTFEYIIHNRLRITGSKLRHVTTGKSSTDGGDYPDDPQQSTLYNWWVTERKKFISSTEIDKTLVKINNLKKEIESWVEKQLYLKDSKDYNINFNHYLKSLSQANLKLSNIEKRLKAMCESLTKPPRIEKSLEKFDKWFRIYNKAQVVRFLTIEIALPILLGLIAISMLSYNLIY